jgi:DNA repair protein RadC
MQLPSSLLEHLNRFGGHHALIVTHTPSSCVPHLAKRFDEITCVHLPSLPVSALTEPESANAQIVPWDGSALPFADNMFDAVFLTHVLSRLTDWRDLLKDALRVLKQRGQFALLEYGTTALAEQQWALMDFEKLMLDRDAVLQDQPFAWLNPEELRKELRVLDVHHLRYVDVAVDDLFVDGNVRAELKRDCLDRIRTDLLPSLARLGTRREEFERRLIELKRRIEVVGVAPLPLSLVHGIKKTVYAPAETSLFAGESFAVDVVESPPAFRVENRISLAEGEESSAIEALTTAELLSLVMTGGESPTRMEKLAQRVLREYGSRAVAQERNPDTLVETLGIGPTRALQIVALFELGRRFFTSPDDDSPVLRGPEDIVRYVADMPKLRREQFRGLFLNNRQRLVADDVIAIGTLTSALVHPREVFRPALTHRAVSLILVHNHPSGDPEPSPDDIEMTRQLHKAGQILGIELLDHVIVAGETWFSMKSAGLF